MKSPLSGEKCFNQYRQLIMKQSSLCNTKSGFGISYTPVNWWRNNTHGTKMTFNVTFQVRVKIDTANLLTLSIEI